MIGYVWWIFCAYKYYTLIWKYILRKFWNINQLNNVYVQYMHNLLFQYTFILFYNISSNDT
jgi:hypothetical protein